MSDNEANVLHKEGSLSSPDTLRGSSELTSPQIPEEKLSEQPEDQRENQEPPNGGLEAWLLVLAGFFVFVNTWGITSTFGAFQAYYQRDLLSSESSSAISWVGSIQATLVVAVGVIVGPLFDKGHLRILVSTGCFLTVFGMMMTSLATNYYQVFLAQGVCVGLGEGMTYIPSLAVIATNFTTKRPIAIGIASIGSSIGGIIFPIMFRKLEPQIGFPWTVRAIAFINLAFAAGIILILGRHRSPAQKESRPLFDLTALREPAFLSFTFGLFFTFLAYYIPLFFVTSYARASLGTSEDFSFYLLAILNASSFLGRTVPYLLGQRVKPIYTLVCWACVGAVLLFAWTGIHNTAGFIVWCVLWGCVAGVLVTAPTSTMPHPVISPSMGVIGTRMGMAWSAAAVGSLIGAPIAGALADVTTASFLHAQIFGGAVMLAGVLCLVWPLVAIERYDRAKRRLVVDAAQ